MDKYEDLDFIHIPEDKEYVNVCSHCGGDVEMDETVYFDMKGSMLKVFHILCWSMRDDYDA